MKRLLFIIAPIFFCSTVFAQITNGRDANIHNYYEQIQKKNEVKKVSNPNQSKPSVYTNADTGKTKKLEKINVIHIGAGGLLTSLNFFKNTQQFTYFPEVSARIYYQPAGFLRLMVDYATLIKQVNIIPTWLNVKSTYIDVDAHILMRLRNIENQNKLFYFIVGASAQSWKGYYTGIDDFNNSALKIQPNTNYKMLYFGGSIGFGFEYNFAPRLGMYGEIRFRVTNTDVGFGLTDVCYGLGIKCRLIDFYPKAIYKRPGKHFKWF